MRYNKIIWWPKVGVDNETDLTLIYCKKRNIPIIIINNIHEFRTLINTNSFIVLSIFHADTYLSELESTFNENPSKIFHFHWRMDEEGYTFNEMKLLTHPNVVKPEDYSILLKLAQQ